MIQEILKNRKKYTLWAARTTCVQRDQMATEFIMPDDFKSECLVICNDQKMAEYWTDAKAIDKYYQKNAKRLLKNSAQKDFKDFEEIKKKLITVSKPKNTDLLKQYQAWLKTLRQYSYFFNSPFSIEEILAKKLTPEQSILAAEPTVLFEYEKLQIDLIKSKGKNLSKITTKYPWINIYSYKEKPPTANQLKKQYQEIKDHASEILARPKTIKQNQAKLAKANKLLKIVNGYVNLRTQRMEIFKQCQYQISFLYKKIYKHAKKSHKNIKFEHIIALTNQEIIDLLKNNQFPPIKELNLRDQAKYCYFKGQFIYDPKEINKIKKAYHSINQKQKELKGRPANPGQANGKVRIISNVKDCPKFKKREILVAEYTNINYVSIMKKAGAIITNDGGITSHASIISRELNIPCIVGTKIATKLLKTGQKVKVNATKGIIKIL